jgi:hypothetical protein
MKKALICLSLLVLMLPAGSYCQLTKGSWFGSFNANLGYNHNHYDMTDGYDLITSTINFSLQDNLGYFVADRLAIGPGITLNISNSKISAESFTGTVINHSTMYSIAFSPFIRYYFATKGKLSFFAQANPSIGYGQNIYKNENDKFTQSTVSFGGGAGIGLVYFIVDNVGLETQISYNFTGNNITQKEGTTEKSSSVNSAIGIGAGFSVYF